MAKVVSDMASNLPVDRKKLAGSVLSMKTKTKETNRLETIGNVTNDGAAAIQFLEPYTVEVQLTGTSDLIFHRWSDDGVAAKAAAAKGSKAKKTDDVETYVWRNEQNFICLPGDYVRGSIIGAAKFRQDPRSPRKSAQDLYKAGIVSQTVLASLGSKDWDYLDRRRVLIQRNAITRIRPAFKTSWKATFQFSCLLPEYIGEEALRDTIGLAGRVIGVGDNRPTFGRYAITGWRVIL